MKDLHQKLLATFQIEHRDHVEQIRSLLSMIESTGGQHPSGPELDEAFRRAHSLKGAARAVDLRTIEDLAHRMETLFSRVRHGACVLNKEVAQVVQQVLDSSEDCIAAVAENRPATGASAALEAIERVLGIEPSAPAAPLAETQAPVPSFQPLEMVRISARNFDELFRAAGELVIETQRQDHVKDRLQGMIRDLAALGKEAAWVRTSANAALQHSGVRNEESKLAVALDSLERRTHSVLRQANAMRRLHQRRSWTMRRLGGQLQRGVRQARMVPAESLLEGYRKMVRDLARDEGKEIEFRASSAGVHADRRVLEALKDPIMHLLRNAVNHGIETGAERVRKGKGPIGLVVLQVDASGQRLKISIQDDGRGLDYKRIAETAAREGILTASEAARCPSEELTRILLRPGFSTSSTVTDISGRGMGLSVVYEALRRLQGDLDIQPRTSGGTSISISAPLSIASHRLLLVVSGGETFAIPVLGIERLHRIPLDSVKSVKGSPVVLLNDQPAPLATIHGLLGLEHSFQRADPNMLHVAVVRSGSQRIAVVVDAVLGETDAVVQDLGLPESCAGRISSGVVLEDGAIAFVIHPMELLKDSVQSQPLQSFLGPLPFAKACEPPPDPKEAPSVLVVDDSLTTRTLEKSILEAHGYRVRVAVDGVEALAALRREKADLVIADIEMPRLNGFGLIEAMRKDRDLERIPVIIVSSIERREDQERGLALGADAYVVKRKFDQEELLATIRQIV